MVMVISSLSLVITLWPADDGALRREAIIGLITNYVSAMDDMRYWLD